MAVKGKDIPTWEELTKTITNTFSKYYIGMENKAARRRSRYGLNQVWTKAILGTLKMNFDAAYKDGKATTGVILRNHAGNILRAWMNHFDFDNAFYAESKAATQALQNAKALQLVDVNFEGDAFGVIMALNGLDDYNDWRAMKNIMWGRKILGQYHCWSMTHIFREANRNSHNLAKWGSSSKLHGSLDVTTLPPAVWCDRSGT